MKSALTRWVPVVPSAERSSPRGQWGLSPASGRPSPTSLSRHSPCPAPNRSTVNRHLQRAWTRRRALRNAQPTPLAPLTHGWPKRAASASVAPAGSSPTFRAAPAHGCAAIRPASAQEAVAAHAACKARRAAMHATTSRRRPPFATTRNGLAPRAAKQTLAVPASRFIARRPCRHHHRRLCLRAPRPPHAARPAACLA